MANLLPGGPTIMAERKRKAWRRGEGGVRFRAGRWEIRYTFNKERHEEFTDAQSRKEATTILRDTINGLKSGRLSVQSQNTRIDDLWELIQLNYKAEGQRVEDIKIRWNHLGPVFGQQLARDVTYKMMNQYVVNRFKCGAAPSTVRNEIACLRRMFRLGVMDGCVVVLPYFPSVHVDNARQIFWEPEEFNRIYDELPEYAAIIILVTLWGGYRLKEPLPLKWTDIDLESGRTVLSGQYTKNGKDKISYLPDPALERLRAWRKKTEALMAKTQTIIPYVFHRNGKPIKSYRTAWDNARRKLGLMGKVVHDLRRSHTRNLRDAKVDDHTGMKTTGHKTMAMYTRYNIRDEGDLKDAAKKLSKLAKKWRTKTKVVGQ